MYLFLQILENLRRIDINSSLNVLWDSPVKLSGPGLLFLVKFVLTDSINDIIIVIGLFRFSLSS